MIRHKWEYLGDGTQVCIRCGCLRATVRIPSPGGTKVVDIYSHNWGQDWYRMWVNAVPECDVDDQELPRHPWQAKLLKEHS